MTHSVPSRERARLTGRCSLASPNWVRRSSQLINLSGGSADGGLYRSRRDGGLINRSSACRLLFGFRDAVPPLSPVHVRRASVPRRHVYFICLETARLLHTNGVRESLDDANGVCVVHSRSLFVRVMVALFQVEYVPPTQPIMYHVSFLH